VESTFIATCPGCQAKLRLKRAAAQGKKIRCPKCAAIFLPAAPKLEDEFSDGLDDFGPLAEEDQSDESFQQRGAQQTAGTRQSPSRAAFDSVELPARVGATPRRPKKTKEAASTGKQERTKSRSKTWPIVAICLLLAVARFVAYTVLHKGGPLKIGSMASSETIDLKYLPYEPEVVIYIRVADMWSAPAGQAAAAVAGFRKEIDVFSKAIGLPPAEIESVTLAIGHRLDGPLAQVGAETRTIVVVRAKKPFDKKAFAETFKFRNYEKREGGLEYTEFSGFRIFRSKQASAVAFPDPQTMLLGSIISVKQVLGMENPPVPELSGIDPKQHIIVATLSQNWPQSQKSLLARNDGPLARRIRAIGFSLFGEYKLAAVGFTFGKSVDLRLNCVCTSSDSAQSVQKQIDENIEASKKAGDDEAAFPLVIAGQAEKSKVFLNPLFNLFLYDFRASGRDPKAKRVWAESAGHSAIELAMRFDNSEAQESASRMIQRLTFFEELKERPIEPTWRNGRG